MTGHLPHSRHGASEARQGVSPPTDAEEAFVLFRVPLLDGLIISGVLWIAIYAIVRFTLLMLAGA